MPQRAASSRRMGEADIRAKGPWRDLDRAVDQCAQAINPRLTAQRDERAALRSLSKAIRRHGVAGKITSDGGEADAAAIRSDNEGHGTVIGIRPVRYLNNLVEQAHRAVKRVTRPVLGTTRAPPPRPRVPSPGLSACTCSREGSRDNSPQSVRTQKFATELKKALSARGRVAGRRGVTIRPDTP